MSFISRITSFPEHFYWSLVLVSVFSFMLPFAIPFYRQRQVTLHFFWGQVPVAFKGLWGKLVVTLGLACVLYTLYEVTFDTVGLHHHDYYACAALVFFSFFALGLFVALKKRKTAKQFR